MAITKMTAFKIAVGSVGFLILSIVNLVVVYFLVSAPPIHFFYDTVPPAGPSSVYVPGSGFSGFWFHLGALSSIPDLNKFDYYCYSSGCLSVVMAALNVSVEDAATMAYGIQQSWLAGNMSRFEIVDHFLDDIFEDAQDDQVESFLSSLNILVTSKGKGVEIARPTSRVELVVALKQTTWIPFVTGDGVLRPSEINATGTCTAAAQSNDENEFYLDGGFSRVLHPSCEHDLFVPTTFIHMLYTLHPGLSREQVDHLWEAGKNFDHPLLTSQ